MRSEKRFEALLTIIQANMANPEHILPLSLVTTLAYGMDPNVKFSQGGTFAFFDFSDNTTYAHPKVPE